MQFFSNKFSPKKTNPRKSDLSILNKERDPDKIVQEFGLDIGQIKIRLGDQEASFENGQWVPESGPVTGTHKENMKLRKYVKQLEDENNLLKLKFELLLDMMTQTTAESHLQEKELEKFKSQRKEVSKLPQKKLILF